tara:strand:- start:316 stop:912 length:597 start_codon:yes stop_codon:yes gene_type:complete
MNNIDLNSNRKLSIIGNGWFVGKISLDYIVRHSCTGAILDEEDFEFEEGVEEICSQFLSFSNSMQIILENIDLKKQKIFEFKNLKRCGIYKGNLDPEDLILTNSFKKIILEKVNHWDYEDEEYYLEFQENWRGIYGEFIFSKGEDIDFQKLNFTVDQLDLGFDYYEWVCRVNYAGKFKEKGNLVKSKRRKRLKVLQKN